MKIESHPTLTTLALALFTAGAAHGEVYTFQQGVNGYSGAVDTGIQQGNPATLLGNATSLSVDLGSASSGITSVSAILLRFDSIMGTGAGDFTLNPPLIHATLTLNVLDAGSGFGVYDMLTPWTDSITWDSSFGTPGFPAAGIGAAATPVTTVGLDSNAQNVPLGLLNLDVTASLQAFQAGTLPGYGWVLLPWQTAGWNGVDVSTSDAATLSLRPLLTVTVPEPAAAAVLLLGLGAMLLRPVRRHNA